MQASILELLDELRTKLEMSTALHLARPRRRPLDRDAVLVLESGHVREADDTETVFTAPTAPYTRALLDAIPDLRPGDYPTEAALTSG